MKNIIKNIIWLSLCSLIIFLLNMFILAEVIKKDEIIDSKICKEEEINHLYTQKIDSLECVIQNLEQRQTAPEHKQNQVDKDLMDFFD